jgi:hypothetical protein
MMKSLLFPLLSFTASISHGAEAKRVANAADAIAAVEPALVAKFGKETIDDQRPFRVRVVRQKDKETVWVVEGRERSAPKGIIVLGGVVFASVRESDSKIFDVFMSK